MIEANNLTGISEAEITRGRALVATFHNKAEPEKLRDLVQKNAPVNFRLDYGLETKLEADFVAALFLLLEGDKGEQTLITNAKQLKGETAGMALVNYTKTSREIFDILYDKTANQTEIGINPLYVRHLEENADKFRANPDQENGSLIIAAGLRNPGLLKKLLEKQTNEPSNGANINFRGYFEETAVTWSAILLDKTCLEVLFSASNIETENLGFIGSTVLHWAIVSAKVDERDTIRQARAKEVVLFLLEKGVRPDVPNKLGKTAIDYTSDDSELRRLCLDHLRANSHRPRM